MPRGGLLMGAPDPAAWWVRGAGHAAHRRAGDQALCGTPFSTPAAWREATDRHRRCVHCLAHGNGLPTTAAVGDATYRQIDYWVRRGWLRPIGAAAPGSGVPRVFPPEELAVADRMARLVRAGLTPEAAHRAARGQPLAPGVTVTIADLGESA